MEAPQVSCEAARLKLAVLETAQSSSLRARGLAALASAAANAVQEVRHQRLIVSEIGPPTRRLTGHR